MKRGLIVVISILLSVSAAGAADNSSQSGADLIAAASDKVNIFALPSFEMKADIRVEIKGKQIDGSYSLLWRGPARWREEISFPGYSEIQVGKEGVVYIQRSTEILPLRIFQLHSALGFGSQVSSTFFNQGPRARERINKIHERKIGGAKAECVQIDAPDKYPREFCVDTASGAPVRDKERFRDRDFSPVGSKIFPRYLSYIEGGSPVAQVQITDLKTDAEMPLPSFDPPPNAPARAGCMNPVPGGLITKVEPQYPQIDKAAHNQGTVRVYALIDKGGMPIGLQVVSSVASGLDKASLDAIRQWRYDPATCDGNPVDVEAIVEVNYTLSYSY